MSVERCLDIFPLQYQEYALTPKQRQAIIDRDDGQSQMRHYSEEKGWHTGGYCEDGGEGCDNLQVHHIVPQRKGGKDEPNNLITLYQCEHTGVCPEGKMKHGRARRKR